MSKDDSVYAPVEAEDLLDRVKNPLHADLRSGTIRSMDALQRQILETKAAFDSARAESSFDYETLQVLDDQYSEALVQLWAAEAAESEQV